MVENNNNNKTVFKVKSIETDVSSNLSFVLACRPRMVVQSEGEHSGCAEEGSAHPRPEAPQKAVAGEFSHNACCAVNVQKLFSSCVHPTDGLAVEGGFLHRFDNTGWR